MDIGCHIDAAVVVDVVVEQNSSDVGLDRYSARLRIAELDVTVGGSHYVRYGCCDF